MGIVSSCLNASSRQLLKAASDGDAETVRQILETKPQLANHTAFITGYNCLHYAAAKGHTAVLQAALEAVRLGTKESIVEKSDDISMKHVRSWSKLMKDLLNQRGSRGETPVMVACEEGHGFAARYLIEQGADPFVQDKTFHRSAIHYAAARGKIDVLRRLMDDNLQIHTEEGFVPLKAARIQDVSGHCRYIDSRAENGLTALHLAAVSGSLECVRLLLDAGASMMVRTVDLDVMSEVTAPAGSTPLHVAAMTGNVSVLQAMLQAHADALGSWGDNGAARRAWEGDGRIDLRSVTNCLRQLPYHVAWQKGFRQAAGVLNPTVPIDTALETCRELGEGFGPQKLAVLAAYSLRQNLLVWLKTYKADVELRQNIDPSVGFCAPSNSGRSNIERAAAAAVAETQGTGDFMSPRGSQFPPMDIMLETDNEGVMDSGASQQQSAASPSQNGAFLNGSGAGSMGLSHNGRGTDPLVHFASPTSRSLQGPSFSSNAFPSFRSHSSLECDANSPQPMPSTSAGTPSEYGSIPHSGSNLGVSSPTSPTGLPKPTRALPPPPATVPVPPSPFAMISPFAQASQSDAVAGFPPLDRANSATGSIQSSSSERERRPTVRFADPPTLDTPAPATKQGRTYNHTNSGFTELVMARGGSSLAPPAHHQADPQAEPQTPGHARSRSDLPSSQRSLKRNKSMSRQERAASLTLDALELPPLPLPAEAVGTSPEEVVSPVGSPVVSPAVSRQPSRQMSLSMRTLSGFRRSRSIAGKQASSRGVSRQPSMVSRAASIAGFEDDYGGDCGICLDEPEQVAINGCNHRLCVDCSISLCEVHKKPPLCPFCRSMISGFHVIPKNKFHVH